MQHHVRTIGLVLIVVLLVVAFIVLRPHATPAKAALTRYAPRDASFALLLRRDFAYDGTGALAKRIPQLTGAAQFIRSEWGALENSLGTRIDRALWYFRAQSGTSGVLLAVAAPLSKDQISSVQSKTYSFPSINNAGAVSASVLTPYIIQVAAPDDTDQLHEELFSDRQAGATVYAVSTFPRAIQEFAATLGLKENAAIFPLTAYADDLGGMVRVQMSSTDTLPVTRMLGLDVPKDAEVILDGFPVQGSGALSELQPFAPVITGLTHTLSNAYSVPTSLITDQLQHTDALVLRGADWMLASRSTTTLAEFASKLMSWTTPRIREGKLPDRTPFREYVRTHVELRQLGTDDSSIMFWGYATSSIAQNGPNIGIYGLSRGDYMVIANKKEMLETAGSDSLRELNFPQVASCILGSELVGEPYAFIADFSQKNGHIQPIISIFGTNASGKSAMHLTCF